MPAVAERHGGLRAAAQVGEVRPGDAVYIPYMWWHGVQSLEPFNLLMNFWWSSDDVAASYPYGALLRVTYELFRNLPPEHRAAWQAMYDYWVFEEHGDPLRHLPEAQRTTPADLTGERVAEFKELQKLYSVGLVVPASAAIPSTALGSSTNLPAGTA